MKSKISEQINGIKSLDNNWYSPKNLIPGNKYSYEKLDWLETLLLTLIPKTKKQPSLVAISSPTAVSIEWEFKTSSFLPSIEIDFESDKVYYHNIDAQNPENSEETNFMASDTFTWGAVINRIFELDQKQHNQKMEAKRLHEKTLINNTDNSSNPSKSSVHKTVYVLKKK